MTTETDTELAQALRKAFALGQTYWQQADSEYTSQHRKADVTRAKFDALVAETIAAHDSRAQPASVADDVARDAARYRWLRDNSHSRVETLNDEHGDFGEDYLHITSFTVMVPIDVEKVCCGSWGVNENGQRDCGFCERGRYIPDSAIDTAMLAAAPQPAKENDDG